MFYLKNTDLLCFLLSNYLSFIVLMDEISMRLIAPQRF